MKNDGFCLIDTKGLGFTKGTDGNIDDNLVVPDV